MMPASWRWGAGLAAIVLVAGAAGYFSTCVLYPTRLVSDNSVVPALRGLDQGEAVARLSEGSLRGRVVDTVPDAEVPSGTVAWQSPAPGTALPAGALVKMALSGGPPPIVVPDLDGFELGLASEVLRAAGLALGKVDTVRSPADAGTIVRLTPPAGSAASHDQAIAVSVSQGIPSVPVPMVIGMTIEEARDRIVAAGLRVGPVRQRLEGTPGTVLEQSPSAGTLAIKGQPVALSVSGAME